ncbi:hypothetical protein LTR85_003771 [Meristemomyces frigidus]|nr:hypothetical protein LTR85_003771 [Meristemomyces frigidus]
MFDSQSGIEAYVAPYHLEIDLEHCHEYLAPESSPLFTGMANERYIEALTDQRFEVGVVLPVSFDFKKNTHVQVSYTIDGEASGVEHVEKPNRRRKEVRDSAASYVGLVDRKWKEIGFSFGELKAVEHCELSREDEDTEISRRGQIKVELQLGHMQVRKSLVDASTHHPLVLESSKRVAVDQGKSHSLKNILLDIDEQRAEEISSDYTWTPAPGTNGRKVEFTFFYASRMILELKKIIPTAPAIAAVAETKAKPSNGKLCSSKMPEGRDRDDDEVMIVPPPKAPAKRIKTEPADNEVMIVAPEHAHKKIKTEGTDGRPAHGQSAAQNARAKEKAKLELELEEIKIRKRSMELDDEE